MGSERGPATGDDAPPQAVDREALLREAARTAWAIAAAWHEAAHAVVRLHLGYKLKYVTIRQDEDSDGHVLAYRARNFRPDLAYGPRRRRVEQTVHRHMLIALAGPAAQRRRTGEWGGDGAADDVHYAAGLADFVVGDPDDVGPLVDARLAEVDELLGRPDIWERVAILAAALLERGTISGLELVALWEQVGVFRLILRGPRPAATTGWAR